jgi:predicted ABC-type ATPase
MTPYYNNAYASNDRCLYVIGGSNGAGKTTFAKEFLPKYVNCLRFVNPDLIAAGLSPFSPESVAAKAGRLMLEEVASLIARGLSFAFESTLSGKTYFRLIEQAKSAGYAVHLFYLWVPDPALALARVRDRVDSGGHDVPEVDVRRRYSRTLHNFFHLYRPLADSVHFFDNTGDKPELVFRDQGKTTEVFDRFLFEQLTKQWGTK